MPTCTYSPSAALSARLDAILSDAPLSEPARALWRRFGSTFGADCMLAALDVALVVAAMEPPRRISACGRVVR